MGRESELAELDRFLLKVVIDYPERAEEAEIVTRMAKTATWKSMFHFQRPSGAWRILT